MGERSLGGCGVLYRVDPRLFQDGDNDGVGDIAGLISRLGYLRWLGVAGLWLAPVEPLPSLRTSSLVPQDRLLAACAPPDAVERLAREAHRLGLRLLLTVDVAPRPMVPQTAATRPDPVPPTEPADSQAATRTLAPPSPARRWLDRGVDAVWTGIGWEFAVPSGSGGTQAAATPAVLTAPRVLLPVAGRPWRRGSCRAGADPVIGADEAPPAASGPWNPRRLTSTMTAATAGNAAANALWMLSDPADARVAGRLGPAAACLAATLLLTLPGTAVVMAGDEIGVVDDSPAPGLARRERSHRSFERAAMAWGDGPGEAYARWPWRPLVDGGVDPVARQQADPDSLLALYRRLIALRRREPALRRGMLTPLPAAAGVLAYLLDGCGSRLLVALNGGPEPAQVPLPDLRHGHVALATDRQREGERPVRVIALRPAEGVIIRLVA